MKPSESKVKGPTGKGSLVKCKRSKSTSSDGEVHSVTHSIQQQQQLRPGLHPPHSTMVNEVSTVRFEQIDNPSSHVVNGSSSSGGSCATSSKLYSANSPNCSNLNTTTPPSTATSNTAIGPNQSTAAATLTATATPAATPATAAATIIASAFPHRTRHSSSLNSALRGFSLRRLFNPSSFGKSTSAQATTIATATTGPAGKVTSSRNTISVDSHNSMSNDSSNVVNKTSLKSNSLSCDNSSLASAKNSSSSGPYDVEAAAASSSSTNNHGTSSKHSSIRSSFHSSIIPTSGRVKSHSAIKTSTSLGHQANSHGQNNCPGGAGVGNYSASTNSNGEVGSYQECPLCLLELPIHYYPQLRTCNHRACYDCLQQYLKIEISESRIMVTCPECTELIHPNDIRTILNDEIYMEKYEKFMLRRVLIAEADARWCPAPDCGYVVIAAGCAPCPKLQCRRPGCHTNFCYHCKQIWHPNLTCDAARAQRLNLNSEILIAAASGGNGSNGTASGDGIILVDGLVTSRHNTRDSDIKNCPHCKVLIIKMDDGSCNHMTCSVCGTEFCWLCMKQITDLHYLSPSGCTFWGKKPWSRKKKIMWQLGMLVGAPVGIALLAGIAVPAIIIGIPVWVGRKLHARFQKREAMSQKNKHLMLAAGVITSVCVSPILALVAVGIGIPILLAYVYGVVPISLCRSGGCNVNTSGSGVRIDMNEESEEISVEPNSTRGAPDGLSVDTALSNKVNPSIGEVSLGMSASLSMGSGSHLDRVTVDRESVSNVPLAGSIYSATPSNKLEVQVDVSSNKRFSFSSHSESASCGISLSERVSNSGALDDGTSSTRGLAGSITGRMVAHHDSLDREITKGNKDIITSGNCQHEVISLTEVQIDPPLYDSSSTCKSISRQISRQDTVITIDSIGSCTSPFGRCVTFQPNLPQTNTTSSTTTPTSTNATGTSGNVICNRSPSSSSSPVPSIASISKSNLAPSHFTQEALNSNTDFNCFTTVAASTSSSSQSSTSTSASTTTTTTTASTAASNINTSSPNCNPNSTVSSNHGSIYGGKSRSLEQLISYCEVCNSSHRPCCPNYASKRVPVFEDVTKELFVGKSTASCNSSTVSNTSNVKEMINEIATTTSASGSPCTSSKGVTSTLSEKKVTSSSAPGEKQSRSNLKRVKSSDSSGVARKSSVSSSICKGNINVTSPTAAITANTTGTSTVVDVGINESSTCNWSTPNSPVEESLASSQLMMQQEQVSSSSITDTFDPSTGTGIASGTTCTANSSNSTASTRSGTFTACDGTILSSRKDGDSRY